METPALTRCLQALLATALLLLLSAATAADPSDAPGVREESWMRVTLEGRKIGHLHATRSVVGGRAITTSETRFEIDRAGTRVLFESTERHVETIEGDPIEFETTTRMGGSNNSTRGKLDAKGRLHVEQRIGDETSTRVLRWPEGAVLSEGARLRQIEAGLEPGTRVSLLTYFPDSLAAATTQLQVGGRERVMLAGHTATLVRIEQSIDIAGARIQGTVWVDQSYQPQRLRVPVLGVALEMLACERACAEAPNQPADVLTRMLVQAPREFDMALLDQPLTWRLRFLPAAGRVSLIDSAEQSTRPDSKASREWLVSVTPDSSSDTHPAPTAADMRPTPWLQSDDADVSRLARAAVGEESETALRMSLLEGAVRRHINRKNLSVGYASAAETADTGQGDCTEHALLLAAMGRSLGIATRVVSGLAFAPEFVDRRQVFVPHAWTQAWVGGRWRSYDAALSGFDAGHIAFSVGDGDPVGFYHSVSLLGATEIVAVEPTPDPPRLPKAAVP